MKDLFKMDLQLFAEEDDVILPDEDIILPDDDTTDEEPAEPLARQIREVVVPEIDAYRIATWSAAAIANGKTKEATITKDNAYAEFLAAQEALDEAKVPIRGRICFATPKYINFIKQDPTFVQASDIAQKMLINGQVGEIDGVRIIKVPSTYFPANHNFILLHPASPEMFCMVCINSRIDPVKRTHVCSLYAGPDLNNPLKVAATVRNKVN